MPPLEKELLALAREIANLKFHRFKLRRIALKSLQLAIALVYNDHRLRFNLIGSPAAFAYLVALLVL
jgi:hypothetical protein